MSVMFGKAKVSHVGGTPAEKIHQQHPEVRVVILGAMGSGKSALTVKFLTKRFISEYDPKLEDIYSSEEVVDHQPITVKVMDTAEQDGPVNSDRYLSWASAFLVVYSIDDRRSFEGSQRYLETVTRHAPRTPAILLGNKLDMERYRQVSKADGSALASRFGCRFYEVSACLDFLSVQRVFHQAAREARPGQAAREARREVGRGGGGGGGERRVPPLRLPLFISEDNSKPLVVSAMPAFATPCYKELPTPATAKLVTVKSARAQSKRRAPTLTLLKGFKIF